MTTLADIIARDEKWEGGPVTNANRAAHDRRLLLAALCAIPGAAASLAAFPLEQVNERPASRVGWTDDP